MGNRPFAVVWLGRGVALASLSAWLPLVLGQAPEIRINEIMYHPPSTNLLEQWFELHNAGANAVDLSGWRLTKGVDFEFPTNTTLAAGGYLVVAADAAVFARRHPEVANFVAGWTGTLNHALELSDRAGQVVNSVEFHGQGDWATRVMGPVQYEHQGWEWFALHDGYGASLELLNPKLPNSYPHNWEANRDTNSTPGRVNSVFSTNVAPFITAVAHAPIIPQPSDPVTISARVVDERSDGLTVTLHWRVDGAADFTPAPMLDDGTHGDGLAGDGIYGAILAAQPNGTVVEFFLEARDLEDHSRTYPSYVPPTNSLRTANLLYQVDNGTYTGDQPVYRLIMTDRERAELYALGRKCPDSDSDAQMNATWITTDGVVSGGVTTQCRYNAGVRNRGHGTRQANPNNYHVNIPSDRLWKKQAGINLNSHYAYSQVLGSAVFRRLGVPMADSRAVQVRVNSTNLMATVGSSSFGSYAANEQYNNDFVQRSFPLDRGGNAYRGIRDSVSCDSAYNGVADLTWHGADYTAAAYTNAYFKENHLVRNDWADLIALLGVLNVTNGTTRATYVTDVQRVLNVDQWMKYLAINTLLDNNETCLANGTGDDYALYRGVQDRRFQVLPYDLDTLMGRGNTATSPRDGIFRMTALPVMNRFMKTPEFVPRYYRWLKTLAETAFSSAQMDPLLDQVLGAFVPTANLERMKAFNASHSSYVLSQIPLTLTVTNDLTVASGYPRTASPVVMLHGQANAIETRSVLVNGDPAVWSAWEGVWTNNNVTLRPGLNRLLVQALGASGLEVARTSLEVWYDTGPAATVGGTLSGNNFWPAASGPYSVASSLTVGSGATLAIEAGTCVYLGSGMNLTVANGGRLLAEGTADAPILFTRAPSATAKWGGVTINGGAGSPESRITYAHLEFNGTTAIHSAGGTVFLDHLTFGATDHQYLSLDSSSFVVSHCSFPPTTASFEPVHGAGGIKSGGRGLFLRNFFGAHSGYNDTIDFTGGNRPAPILQVINNVFTGTGDDNLDVDGTDAWVEGNLFLHAHKNGAPDSSSAVSGGSDSGLTSEVTIVGNLFYDCDQAAMAKQGNFFTLLNNTIVRQTHQGGTDTAGAVVCLADEGTSEGAGMYLEGNIIYDAEQLTRNLTAATVTFTHNLMPLPWAGPGGGNSTADPLLEYIPQMSETFFTTWQEAQVLRDWFRLRADSPARGAGPQGRDQGGVIPLGVFVAGAPTGTNAQTSVTLRVEPLRTGSGIPSAAWPQGAGYTHYKWRLDGGAWSAETPTATPIVLEGLASGPHQVDVVGKRDSGWYQDDPLFGPDALVASSGLWTVDPAAAPPGPTVRLNEVLAKNLTTLTNAGTAPDLIELFNSGAAPVDLSGLGLSDRADDPYRFQFPPGTLLEGGTYLVVYADNAWMAPGLHTGFGLKQSGDRLFLHDSLARGGAQLDSVRFGLQVPDLSLGRVASGAWALCRPTFGAENVTVSLGDSALLKINEWLADTQFAAPNDFVELYNPNAQPVALGGLFLSDAAGAPDRHVIPPFSFLAGHGLAAFVADGDAGQGADHLNFKLSADVGLLLLSAPDLTLIDAINYGPQRTDVSQGRSPGGSDTITVFAQPTAGGPNPGRFDLGSVTNVSATAVSLLSVTATSWRYDTSGTNHGTAWRAPGFDDSASPWASGFGLFGYETTPGVYPHPFQTRIPAPNQAGGQITVYYRTHFQWTNALANFQLVATNYLDDGAAFYLNGVEVDRLRLAANPAYTTTATNQPQEGLAEVRFWRTNDLVVGDNVLAVEVHQSGSGSSDDVFGLSLAAVQYTTNVVVLATGVPVVLNEILASNRSLTNLNGLTADYVELYNPSTNEVDLSDLSLSNDPNQPRKWVFPAGTTLGPLGYQVVYCEGALPPSATNTGFSLSAQGDTVLFFHRPEVRALLDGVRFGLQVPDLPVGRSPNGTGNWTLALATPGGPNEAAGIGPVSALRINEWMANPVTGSDWFELYNGASQPVPLGGLFFTDNLTDKWQSPVEPLSFIGTGANAFLQFFADGNGESATGADHVGFNLKKSGEALGLFSPSGVLIDGVMFGPQATGISQGRLTDGALGLVSFDATPSPAESNYLPLPNVVINEVLTHTDPPLEDALELYNPTAAAVDLGGWYLSNDPANLKKYRIPDRTLLGSGAYMVFYQYQFGAPDSPTAFAFNSAHGDSAILAAADALGNLTGYRAQVKFGAAQNGVSFGRYQTTTGVDFVPLRTRTFGEDNPASLAQFRAGAGQLNAYPTIGPLVLNEVMYYATNEVENPDFEFVELYNPTGASVPLFDPAYPTNTWRLRDAVDYDFPLKVALAAGGRLLVVGFSPSEPELLTAFRARFNVATNVPIFGPWRGRLDNDGDNVELYRPDTPQQPPQADAGFVPYLLVDRVRYRPMAPWPVAAAGGQASLQRLSAADYGNDPVNWMAAAPTAGRPNGDGSVTDSDADGLLDSWELASFGTLARDGAGDFDSDGFTDRQEYLAGTNPTDPADYLKAGTWHEDGRGFHLRFLAVAGKSYSLLRRDAVNSGTWIKVTDVGPQPATAVVEVTDPSGLGLGARFYRLVTPSQPQ